MPDSFVCQIVALCVHSLKRMLASFCFQTEEERPIFRPFTRESLAQIEARIQEENEKKRELEKKRAEGEVRTGTRTHSRALTLTPTATNTNIYNTVQTKRRNGNGERELTNKVNSTEEDKEMK